MSSTVIVRFRLKKSPPRVQDDQGYDATPETKNKLRHDVVLKLYSDGKLSKAELEAAEQIRAIMEAVEIAAFAKSSFDGVPGPMYRSPPSPISARLEPSIRKAWKDNYMPWTVILPHRHLEAITLVVKHNWKRREVERKLFLKNGTATVILKAGLYAYAEMAGFVSRRAA